MSESNKMQHTHSWVLHNTHSNVHRTTYITAHSVHNCILRSSLHSAFIIAHIIHLSTSQHSTSHYGI